MELQSAYPAIGNRFAGLRKRVRELEETVTRLEKRLEKGEKLMELIEAIHVARLVLYGNYVDIIRKERAYQTLGELRSVLDIVKELNLKV